MQQQDPTLQKYRTKSYIKTKGDIQISFEGKEEILYRMYKSPTTSNGRTLCHVMVYPSRSTDMDIAHSSIMGGYMGVQ